MERKHFLIFIYTLLFTLILMACASMGNPDGGPYDETPPKIVRTSPKYGETVSSAKKVVIEFDEIVKIENAQEKVMISPPQIEQPEIEAVGKKITVTLLDTLKPNTTYTIDFADAIVDNNEGNPFGDYAFTFSTGADIDTMQVSGNVLEAENLEPIKGMLVGLYKMGGIAEDDSVTEDLPDSIFRTKQLERISRTDSRGHFVIKGLAPGKYRVYALDDKNQNFLFDQRSEKIAVSQRILSTSSKPDIRQDTIWHDSIHYDSIISVPYTHYYPDDIVLLAYQTAAQDRFKLKEERPELHKFMISFTAPSDTLPLITGLNFDATDAFVADANLTNDSIVYWIKDSLIYNLDTLEMRVDFYATDSTGVLSLTNDTLRLVSKISKEKLAKQNQEKWDNWVKECKQKAKEERRAAKRSEGKKDEYVEEIVNEEAVEETKDKPTEDATEEVAEEKKDEVTEEVTEDTAEETKDEATEKVAEEAAKETTEEVTEEVAEEKKEEITDEPKEDIKEKDKKESKKATKEEKKSNKKSSKKDENLDFDIPPMPEEFLEIKVKSGSSMAPDKNVEIEFDEPLDSFDLSKIHFTMKVDSVYEPAKFVFKQVPGNVRSYRLYAEWEADSTYQLEIDTAAFVNIYGKRCASLKQQIKIKSMDEFATLFVTLQNADSNAVVQLMDGSDKVVKTVKANKKGNADFYFLNPGTFYLRMFYDTNGNGKWDTGDYDAGIAPEEVYYSPMEEVLKAKWETKRTWDPKALPIPQQKPAKITKQKADKDKKTTKSKNEERERLKREGKNGSSNSSTSSNSNSFF